MLEEVENKSVEEATNLIKKESEFNRILNMFDEEIHAAGEVKKVNDGDNIYTMIIEPIESNEYVYNIMGRKGTTHIVPNTKTNMTFMNIEGRDFILKGQPLDDGMFSIINRPSKKLILNWVKGKVNSKTSIELYDLMNKYFRLFLDLGEDCYYDLLVMTVFQSWLQDLLKSVWYVSITGEFGGGKTSTMEACAKICKHGCTPGDASVSFISRGIDMLKMVPFLDEFDSIAGEEDSEHYAIIRMGQRRGQPFSRMGDKGGSFQTFDVFGTKLISVHGQLEDALQSRSLIINTCESEDNRVAQIARAVDSMSKFLYDELFIWYLSNIHSINMVDLVDLVDYLLDTNNSVDSIRNDLASIFIPPKIGQLSQPKKFRGRDAEIQSVWLALTQVLGFESKVNQEGVLVNDVINQLINLKSEIRDEMRETGTEGLIRDFLIRIYKKYRNDENYWTDNGFFMISHKFISEEFKKDAKSKGEYNITKGGFSGALKEMGFTGGTNGNKRKMKIYDDEDKKKHVRLALIFDERVQRRLGVKIENHVETGGLLNHVEDEKNNV